MSIIQSNMSVADRITRQKIQLQKQSPFFAHLVMNLTITENNEAVPTMGVDCSGNMVYNKEFVKTLTDEQLKGVLCHEVMHVALLHLLRLGKKDFQLWNVAADVAINYIILLEGLDLPGGCILPNTHSNTIEFPIPNQKPIIITDLDKKTANEVYEELWNQLPKKGKGKGGSGKSKDGYPLPDGFDEHIYNDDMTDAEKDAAEKEWRGKLVDAATAAKARGKLPGGIKRLVDDLLNPKLNWKSLLYQFITKDIIYNYTMAKPGRKSYSTGVYMPTPLKENLNITVTVDTSGSINQEEYQTFISEIGGIANAFRQVNMTLLFWDTEVRDEMKITAGNIQKLIDMKIPGGGGTEIGCLSRYYKNGHTPRLMVHLTDGYTESNPKLPRCQHLFVISDRGTDSYLKGSGATVSLK